MKMLISFFVIVRDTPRLLRNELCSGVAIAA